MIFSVQYRRFVAATSAARAVVALPMSRQGNRTFRHGERRHTTVGVNQRQRRIVTGPAAETISRALTGVNLHSRARCVSASAILFGVTVNNRDVITLDRVCVFFHLSHISRSVSRLLYEQLIPAQHRAIAIFEQPIAGKTPASFRFDHRLRSLKRLVQRIFRLHLNTVRRHNTVAIRYFKMNQNFFTVRYTSPIFVALPNGINVGGLTDSNVRLINERRQGIVLTIYFSCCIFQ